MLEFFFAKARPRMLELWREFDLMPPQQMVLGLLDEPRPMGELAQQMHCDNSNITGIVDRLTERGLVERRAAEGDRRVKLVALTDAGRALRDELARRRCRAARGDRRALGRRPAQAARDLHQGTRQVVDYAGRRMDDLGAPISYLAARAGSRRVQQRRREAGRGRPRCAPTPRRTSSTASSSTSSAAARGRGADVTADRVEEIYERGVRARSTPPRSSRCRARLMAVREATEADLEALAPLLRGYTDFYESNPTDDGARGDGARRDRRARGAGLPARRHRRRRREVVGFALNQWKWSSLRGAPGGGHGRPVRRRGRPRRRPRRRPDRGRRRGRPPPRGADRSSWFTMPDNKRAHAVYDRVGGTRRDAARVRARALTRPRAGLRRAPSYGADRARNRNWVTAK